MKSARIKAEYIVEVIKDGRKIYSHKSESRSLLQNFGKMLMGIMFARGSIGTTVTTSITDTTGTLQTVPAEWWEPAGNLWGGGTPMACKADDDVDSYGIIVGGGTKVVSPTDYNLASKIAHGSGAGQLDYGPHTITSSYSATSSYAEISRTLTNISGNDVTVREVGLAARNFWKDTAGIRYDVKYIIARDILPTPIKVPALATLLVRYRVSLTT
jgi:hypothetical protein